MLELKPRWSRSFVVAVCASSLLACVAQVRGKRVQAPVHEAPEGTRIALVSVESPPWVTKSAPKGEDPAARMKAAALAAFEKEGPYELVDATASGFRIPMGPDAKPMIISSATSITEVGKPYQFDADGIADAYGVHPITWATRKVPQGFNIDPQSGQVTWTPTEKGEHEVEIFAGNRHGETPYTFKVTVVDAGKVKETALSEPRGWAAQDQAFAATLPSPVPPSIEAPLLMAIHVVSWTGSPDAQTMQDRSASTDVVYTIWTREGRELETRRVRVDQKPGSNYHNSVHFVPDRAWSQKWHETWDSPLGYAPFDGKEVMAKAASANALSFAYPWTPQNVSFTAQLDESNPALKPGIELSNKKDYEGAYTAFEAAAQADPKLAGAFYNMGVMREIQGKDEEALELYRQAHGLNPNEKQGMYRRQLDNVQKRIEERKAARAEQ